MKKEDTLIYVRKTFYLCHAPTYKIKISLVNASQVNYLLFLVSTISNENYLLLFLLDENKCFY